MLEVWLYNSKVLINKYLWFVCLMAICAFMMCCSGFAGDDYTVTQQFDMMQDEMRALKNEINSGSASYAPESLRSSEGNATLRIGGELFTDYIGSIYEGNSIEGVGYQGAWYVHNTNLRFDFNINNELKASIKLDLSDSPYRSDTKVMEEAMVIWQSVCGGPIGLFFGVGEVPYGQDRTLGIIQSYNHTEGNGSSEGPIILNAPVFAEYNNRDSVVYHPGEIDRVVMAGISYTWQDILKIELATFNSCGFDDQIGNYNRDDPVGNSGFESFAGRVWWNTPIEGLVAEISGVRKYEKQRGDNRVFGSNALRAEYAVSVGLDWDVNNQFEIFAEYQHGFNWGFQEGYNTDTISVGSLYALTDKLSLGGMVEWLHISDNGQVTDLNKFVLHTQYKFANGVFFIAEYGAELYNWDGAITNMFAFRTGVSF